MAPQKSASISMSLLLCCLTACAPYQVSSTPHDEARFERGSDVVDQGHFDVARLTFQTLINTYPDSPYADKARLAFQGQQLATCGDDGNASTNCKDVSEPDWPK